MGNHANPPMHQRLTSSRIKKSTELARSAGHDLWLSDDHGAYGNGRLVLRVSTNGVQRFYYRPPRATGRSQAVPLGLYSRVSQVGYLTLTQARAKASDLCFSLTSSETTESSVSKPQALQADTASHTLQASLTDTASSIGVKPKHKETPPLPLTLAQLCRDYVKHLQDNNKVSAKENSALVERLIVNSALANEPARAISPSSFADFLRSVIGKSSGRTAAKVRSILHAAFALALKSKLDPAAPKSKFDYGIDSNPITGIDSLAQYKKARTRYLRDSELKEVWRSLQKDAEPSIPVRGARLCLLLGGQRAQQVVSIKVTNVDLEAKTILLFDGKGRRAVARQHLLPLLPIAYEEVKWLVNYALSINSPHLLPGSKRGTRLNSNPPVPE